MDLHILVRNIDLWRNYTVLNFIVICKYICSVAGKFILAYLVILFFHWLGMLFNRNCICCAYVD